VGRLFAVDAWVTPGGRGAIRRGRSHEPES
jgi:hypothetical protein